MENNELIEIEVIYSNGSIKILEVRGTSCGKAKTNN